MSANDQFDPKTARLVGEPKSSEFDPSTAQLVPAQDNAFVRGWKNSTSSMAITKDLAAGDAASVARRVKESYEYNQANPGSKEGQELSKAWEAGDGITGGVSNVAGKIADDFKNAPNWVGGIRSLGANAKAMGEGICRAAASRP